MTRQFLIELLRNLEQAVPPPQYCHHAITYAQYGSDEVGWEDKLALQVNNRGAFHCFFLDDADFTGTPADLVSKIAQLISDPPSYAQLGAGPGQYLSEAGCCVQTDAGIKLIPKESQ